MTKYDYIPAENLSQLIYEVYQHCKGKIPYDIAIVLPNSETGGDRIFGTTEAITWWFLHGKRKTWCGMVVRRIKKKKKAWLKTLTEAQKEIYDQYEAQKVMNVLIRALPMIGIAAAAATLLKLVRKGTDKPLLQ